jgi:S1-C subfamily serine protease
VKSVDDLLASLERHRAGDMVTITFLRDGERRETRARLRAED